jgi:hypothetical protein
VSEADRRYENGGDPALLDIIDVEFTKPSPEGHQPENWLIDDNYYWVKRGRAKLEDLDSLVGPKVPLWGIGNSTGAGLNDRVTMADAISAGSSLVLVRTPKLQIKVFKPGEDYGNLKRRVQGRFKWAGHSYYIWVTDPIIEKRYLGQPDGEHDLGACFLTISLGEFEGACYKLIAAVIQDIR